MKYKISDEDFAEILKINKEGGDRVMYLGGGQPLGTGNRGEFRSKQEKINDFWKEMGKRLEFDWTTVRPTQNLLVKDREFEATSLKKGE